jgi:hypothetical protein
MASVLDYPDELLMVDGLSFVLMVDGSSKIDLAESNTNWAETVAGAQTNTGAPVKLISTSRTAGSQTNTGAMSRITNKVLAGSQTATGALVRQTNKVLAGAITFGGALTNLQRKVVSMILDVQIVSDVIARIQPINEDR